MIRISNIMNAIDIAKAMNADAIISLVDQDTILPIFPKDVKHLIRRFNDTEVQWDMFAPMRDDIDTIFSFAKDKDNILVHCIGGISRSAAIGIGLNVARCLSVKDATILAHKDSPNLSPNRLILRLIDDGLEKA